MDTKICFITAIYKNYEKTCKPFIKQTVKTDFICFTDNPEMESNGWILDARPYHYMFLHPVYENMHRYGNSLKNNNHSFNIAKYYKQAFQTIPRLKEYDIIVWVDGTIEITNPKTSEWLIEKMKTEKIITGTIIPSDYKTNKENKNGERREYFIAEKDMWIVIRQIIIHRKKKELEPALNVLEEVQNVDEESSEKEEFVNIIREIELSSVG
jgi:hypothetical protein